MWAHCFRKDFSEAMGFMAYRTMNRPTFENSLSKWKPLTIFGPYGPIFLTANAARLLDVPASGRKETHVASAKRNWRCVSFFAYGFFAA
jgi:hypothetical protein